MTLLEQAQRSPGFKAFCRRRINGKSKTMEQLLAEKAKKTQADIRAFMKRRGPLSVLKESEYTTTNSHWQYDGDIIHAKIRREKNGDFTSVIVYDSRKKSKKNKEEDAA